MADNVQWIRLKVGMFDGNSFKKIKRAKIGGVSYRDKLTAVWFELLDLAGKSNANGFLIDNNEIPYQSFSDIATMLDREDNEIELCMGFFIAEKMVEIVDDTYLLTNFVQYQNQDAIDKIRKQNRERQAKLRAKNKNLLLLDNVTSNNITCVTNNGLSQNSNVTSNVTSRDKSVDDINNNAKSVTSNVTSRDNNEEKSVMCKTAEKKKKVTKKEKKMVLNNNVNTTQLRACAGAREVTVEDFETEMDCVGWGKYPNGEVYERIRDTLLELINDGTVALWEVSHELIGEMLNSMFKGTEKREVVDLRAYLFAIIERKRKKTEASK